MSNSNQNRFTVVLIVIAVVDEWGGPFHLSRDYRDMSQTECTPYSFHLVSLPIASDNEISIKIRK